MDMEKQSKKERGCVSGGGGGLQRQRERERPKGRQADRQTNRETETERETGGREKKQIERKGHSDQNGEFSWME